LFCMSRSSSLTAILAFAVALTSFSGLTFSAPIGYPEDSLWEHGLVREVLFDPEDYRSPCFVRGRLVLLNPTDVDVVFDLAYPLHCEVYFEAAYQSSTWRGGEGSLRVTVPAHGEYTVISFTFQTYAPGFYEVDWGGLRRSVDVSVGDLIPRVVTDKQAYRQFEGGYATFEYYNPKSYPVSFGPPSSVELGFEYDGVKEDYGTGVNISWVSANFTVPPGGTFKIYTFVFTTSKVGHLTLTGMWLRKTVNVLPLEP